MTPSSCPWPTSKCVCEEPRMNEQQSREYERERALKLAIIAKSGKRQLLEALQREWLEEVCVYAQD